MIAKIHSAIPYGFNSATVEVEGDMNRGLPAFNIVGMANKTINESKDRVRSAVINSGFSFPDKKITINLAPAELPKDGTHLDLPIALTVMVLSGQITKADVDKRIFVGELSLTGDVRPVKGIINIVEAAVQAGYREIFIPIKNLPQAVLVEGIKIYGVESLRQLFLGLKNQEKLPEADQMNQLQYITSSKMTKGPFLDHICGQELAKRAITVAIAGRHNILISGPPGAGKTLLAKTAVNLLPDLTPKERVEITKLYSISGLATDMVVEHRPFRSPHHTASVTSVIGGTNGPGEISLAHKGVLFLDEIPEFPRSVLEALRQPLEDKKILISRSNQKNLYPADFMLIATMNPCPCGYLDDPTHECNCTEMQIQNYRKKLSGPLFDRIDMNITVEKVDNNSLREEMPEKPKQHIVVKNNITEAIKRQAARYGRTGFYNSSLSSHEASKIIKLDPAAEKMLTEASERLSLSARAYFKTMKVAQTIADLDKSDVVLARHLAEALTYRKR